MLPLIKRLFCVFALLLLSEGKAFALQCDGSTAGEKNVYWGDLHVHSGYSLDAWGFGTALTPADAYAFAKGGTTNLAGGQIAQLVEPLDFMAVTDHAEWFDLMYVCTNPLNSDHEYCKTLTTKNNPVNGTEVFGQYVVPTITKASPEQTPICKMHPELCARAAASQWQRVQDQANAANDPCEFTSFVAYEWSATPDFSHTHRNLIFANEHVTPEAIDYMRYPTPQLLWQELDTYCKAEDGCDVIAIPHNTNMSDGKSFDIETESPQVLALRAKYERLLEVHQEKGNSECLPAFGRSDEDCSFEITLTKSSQAATQASYTEEEWERMRGGYARGLLLRGLYGYQRSGARQLNPLQLGLIGSTDNHSGTGGFVDDQIWPGTGFGGGDFDRAMLRGSWNPGGLVAVWAEENTRESIFAALKRREVYATSGPRMRVRLSVTDAPVACEVTNLASADVSGSSSTPVPNPGQAAALENTHETVMGGTLSSANQTFFRIQAQGDRMPIGEVQVIRGWLDGDEVREEVVQVWQKEQGVSDLCVNWRDTKFDPNQPAFWYARVLQVPTPRWSAHQCLRYGRCDDYPQANKWIKERAWTSPVWHLPAYTAN